MHMVAECYQYERGTDIDRIKAFNFMKQQQKIAMLIQFMNLKNAIVMEEELILIELKHLNYMNKQPNMAMLIQFMSLDRRN